MLYMINYFESDYFKSYFLIKVVVLVFLPIKLQEDETGYLESLLRCQTVRILNASLAGSDYILL